MTQLEQSPLYRITKEEWQDLINSSSSYSEILSKVKRRDDRGSYSTLRKILSSFSDLDYSKMKENAKNKVHTGELSFDEVFKKGTHFGSSLLRNKLIKSGIKTFKKCECCGISEWMGKPITIQLHHKDGDHTNNEIDNIAELCPNCHSQTDSYAKPKGNNLNSNLPEIKKEKVKNYCLNCGKEIWAGSKYCLSCENERRWKNSNRPSKEILEKELENFVSYVELGKKYNTSDTNVKNWILSYNLPLPKRKLVEYKAKVRHPEYQVYTTRKTATGWEKYLKLGQHKIARYVPDHTVSQIEDYIKIFYDEAVEKGIIDK